MPFVMLCKQMTRDCLQILAKRTGHEKLPDITLQTSGYVKYQNKILEDNAVGGEQITVCKAWGQYAGDGWALRKALEVLWGIESDRFFTEGDSNCTTFSAHMHVLAIIFILDSDDRGKDSWNYTILNVPSNPRYSVILLQADAGIRMRSLLNLVLM